MAGPRRLSTALALCLAVGALPTRHAAQAPTRTLFVTVTDNKGNFVRGLKPEEFAVTEGKRRHEPASFREADEPVTVGLVLDASGSTSDEWKRVARGKGGNLREMLARFFAGSHPDNEYFVVAFNHQPHLVVEETAAGHDVLAGLERFAAAGRPTGQTAFYDALNFALERAARGRHAKRVLIALTDGQDNASKRTFRQTLRALSESDVLVYSITRAGPVDDSALGYSGRNILSELSEPTGGASFFPLDGREMAEAADRLAAELRSQYALAVAAGPSEKRDGWHGLKVAVSGPRDEKGKPVKLKVRARRGFYDEGAGRAGGTP